MRQQTGGGELARLIYSEPRVWLHAFLVEAVKDATKYIADQCIPKSAEYLSCLDPNWCLDVERVCKVEAAEIAGSILAFLNYR